MTTLKLDFEMGLSFAESPNTAPEVLARLHDWRHPDIDAALASNPRTPESVLRSLFEIGRYDLALAGNPSSPPDLLEALATRVSDRGAIELARHPQASHKLLRRLARHPNPWVRMTVAERPSLDSELAIWLAYDLHPDVRATVIKRHPLPRHVLIAVIMQADFEILKVVALHPKLCTDDAIVWAWMQRASVYQKKAITGMTRVHPKLLDALSKNLGESTEHSKMFTNAA